MSYTVYGPDARRLLERLEQLEAEKTNTWVDASDRLPANHEKVIVWSNTAGIFLASRVPAHNADNYWRDTASLWRIHGVTHWQPLPKPPTKL